MVTLKSRKDALFSYTTAFVHQIAQVMHTTSNHCKTQHLDVGIPFSQLAIPR